MSPDAGPPSGRPRDPDPVTPLALLGIALVAFLLLAGAVRLSESRGDDGSGPDAPTSETSRRGDGGGPGTAVPSRDPGDADYWRTHRVFAPDRTLVAYYGTAGTGVLGVLGESPPDAMRKRLAEQARYFARGGHDVQPVYELIVTVADPVAGDDGNFSHPLSRAQVEPYVRAAREHGALLLLDLQTGRQDFLTATKHWRWALEKPWVGLALDPEWRMAPGEVPGRVLGEVSAPEVNRTSAWLSRLVRHQGLPQKLFVLHQFRTDMIPGLDRVRARPGLAMVQHLDGFGTRSQKLSTFHAVVRPPRLASQFFVGFKLFYDEDVRLMHARDVYRIRPPVRFVSYQ